MAETLGWTELFKYKEVAIKDLTLHSSASTKGIIINVVCCLCFNTCHYWTTSRSLILVWFKQLKNSHIYVCKILTTEILYSVCINHDIICQKLHLSCFHQTRHNLPYYLTLIWVVGDFNNIQTQRTTRRTLTVTFTLTEAKK